MNQPCQECGDKTATYFGNGQWCGDCVPERIITLQAMKPEPPTPYRDIWQRVAALEEDNQRNREIIDSFLIDISVLKRNNAELRAIITERTADS